MRKLFIILAITLIGSFAFANTEGISESDVKKVESIFNQDNNNSFRYELLACTSTTTTITTTNPDGSSTSTTTTIVKCDTPRELALYHKEMGIKSN